MLLCIYNFRGWFSLSVSLALCLFRGRKGESRQRGKTKNLSPLSTRFVVLLSSRFRLSFVRFFSILSSLSISFEPSLLLLGHRKAAAERLALQLLLRDLFRGALGARPVGGRGFLRQVPEGDVSDHQDADEPQADRDDGAGGGVGLDVERCLFFFPKKKEEVPRVKLERERRGKIRKKRRDREPRSRSLAPRSSARYFSLNCVSFCPLSRARGGKAIDNQAAR